MKNLVILIIGIVIGYGLFSFQHPSQKFITTRTITRTNTIPIEVKETRYHSSQTASAEEKIPAPKVSPVIEYKAQAGGDKNSRIKLQSSAKFGLENKDDISIKTYLGLNRLPFLAATDARLIKLKGNYLGKMTFFQDTRTGEPAKAALEISEKRTALTIIDSYDNMNEDFSISGSTASLFKTIPGDENLIAMFLNNSSRYIIFDLRTWPDIKGKSYSLNHVSGTIDLKRKQLD